MILYFNDKAIHDSLILVNGNSVSDASYKMSITFNHIYPTGIVYKNQQVLKLFPVPFQLNIKAAIIIIN